MTDIETDSEREDRVLLELLEASDPEEVAATCRELEERTEPTERAAATSWVRGYGELLGLIPAALEPVAPPPEAKTRLMAAVAAQGSSDSSATPISGHPRFAPAPLPEPASGTAGRSLPPAAGRRGSSRSVSRVASNDNRFRSFLLAAVIALMMIGVSGWFAVQLAQQRQMAAQLQQELGQTKQRLEQIDDGRRDIVAALRDLGMMSPQPVDWCPLRPVGDNPPQPDAHGSLLLLKENDRWSVYLRDLEPAVGGQVYVLWFLDEDAALKRINLGRGDRPVKIAATGIPMLMTAAAVTLESSPEAAEPSGPRILYGHSREMDRL